MQLISFGRPGLLFKSIRDTCEATESSWFRLIMAPQLENVNAESSTFPVEFNTAFIISDTILAFVLGEQVFRRFQDQLIERHQHQSITKSELMLDSLVIISTTFLPHNHLPRIADE